LKLVGPNFSNISFLLLHLLKHFKKYIVGPPNFINIRFLLLNLFEVFKRYVVSLRNSSYFLYMTLLNWFNLLLFWPPNLKILVPPVHESS